MNRKEKMMRKIREAEAELVYASPPRAAKLASKLVKWKATVFDE